MHHTLLPRKMLLLPHILHGTGEKGKERLSAGMVKMRPSATGFQEEYSVL
jgi:hypothetical protein